MTPSITPPGRTSKSASPAAPGGLAIARAAISQRIAARIEADPDFRSDFQVLLALSDAQDAAAGRSPQPSFTLAIELQRADIATSAAQAAPSDPSDLMGLDAPPDDLESNPDQAGAPASNPGVVGPSEPDVPQHIVVTPPWPIEWPPRDFPPYYPWFGWPVKRVPYPPRFPLPQPMPPQPRPILRPLAAAEPGSAQG